MVQQIGLMMMRSIVKAWRQDRYTAEHSKSVARLAVDLGRRLGMSRAELDRLRLAGLLHDLGKLAIPRQVLYKRERLSPDEWALIVSHPTTGAWLLEMARVDPEVVRAVRQHHERLDGSGYPAGLSGDDISLLAQFVAVADACSAMVHERPYRRPLPPREALRLLSDERGLNQEIVAALSNLAHTSR
ncbi:MAG TPA: HD domain-containing protein [Firmicutes bacterium]|nr:HD domain-containing protein [Bacillota bacterium]